MIVSISQPAYLPWLGYFDRINSSDIYVVLDHVQFEKRSFTSRNKILTANGPLLLSVPVKTKGLFGQATIDKLEIDNSTDWRSNHWKNIKQAYQKAPYFALYKDAVESIYAREWTHLNDLCHYSTPLFVEMCGIDKTRMVSSQMQARTVKDELIIDLSKECGATTYISGPFGRDYLKKEDFDREGIKVLFHDYKHPQYQQMGKRPAFEPYMCILDLLFNEGPRAKEIFSTPGSLSSSWQVALTAK